MDEIDGGTVMRDKGFIMTVAKPFSVNRLGFKSKFMHSMSAIILSIICNKLII